MDRVTTYRRIAWALAGLGGIVFVGSACLYAWALGGGLSDKSAEWGAFGDFVGGFAGAFVSLLALIALAITLHLQAKELQETTQALKEQARSSVEQNSLSFFFELLRERSSVIEAWETLGNGTRGRRGLSEDAVALRVHAERVATNLGALGEHTWGWLVDRLAIIQPLIGVHTEMLRLMDQLNFNERTRPLAQRLSVTYATTLSVPEFGLLFYYGLTAPGQRELSTLMGTHAVFRNRDTQELGRFVAVSHLNQYEPRYFGSTEAWP